MELALYWSIFLFNLRIHNCINNFPYTFLPFTYDEKKEICIAKVLREERYGNKNTTRNETNQQKKDY